MLNHIRIGPDGLVRIFGQHAGGVFANAGSVGLDRGIHPHIVLTRSPRRTVALSTTYLVEQLLAALHLGIVQIAGSGNSQATVPYHELVVLLVAHLLLAVIGLAVEQVLLEGLLLADVLCAEHLVDAVGDASVCAVGIVGVQQAALVGAKLLDIADNLGIFTLCLRPFGGGVEEVAVRAGHVGDVPDSVGTSTILQ